MKKLNNNIIAWFLASFFTTLSFAKNWIQGTFDVSFPMQILAYVLCILIAKKIYKFVLDI